jgi:ribonuclease HII
MTAKFNDSLLPEAPDLSYERNLWQQGCRYIAGIDEAGRGPIAGPISAAAVILPPYEMIQQTLQGVRDSKQMFPEDRVYWSLRIKESASAYGIGFASSEEIDSHGIMDGLYLAIQRALSALSIQPDHLLVDYLTLPGCKQPQTAIVKGDARSLSIAAASVLAKTARDQLLCELDEIYPGYGFGAHKGYCTPSHLHALETLGPCPIHRKSFRPIRTNPLQAT